MKKLLCILMMLLFAFPVLAQENPFAPYEIALPQGAVLESSEGSYAFVMGQTRVVAMVISRVPDDDPESAVLRMMSQFDPDAVLEEVIPMAEGYVSATALSEGRFGEGVDQLNVLILSQEGELLILSGYDLEGDESKVQTLLDALLAHLTVGGESIVTKE